MNLFSNVSAAWRVFKAGEAVADPAGWKQHQITVNQVTLLLAAVAAFAKGVGIDLHMDDATLGYLAAGLFGLVNWLFTVVTTDKVGVLGQRTAPAGAGSAVDAAVAGPARDAAAQRDAQPAASVGGQPAIAPAPRPLRPAPDGSTDQNGNLRAGG